MDTRSSWFIIASGPSLTKKDIDSIKGQNVICINDNYRIAPWADVLYACDPHWWEWHKDKPEFLAFKGEKWTQCSNWNKEQIEVFKRLGVNWIESKNLPGLSTDPSYIHQGSNSGIQAINLAYHWGAKRIVLLGYDMQPTGGKSHWHGDHPNGVRSCWHNWLKLYDKVAEHANELGLEIINATRETALTCFPRVSLESINVTHV